MKKNTIELRAFFFKSVKNVPSTKTTRCSTHYDIMMDEWNVVLCAGAGVGGRQAGVRARGGPAAAARAGRPVAPRVTRAAPHHHQAGPEEASALREAVS